MQSKKSTKSGSNKYRIAFDCDGTICEHIRDDHEGDILKVKPYPHMIKMIRDLKDRGHHIIIFTRRGILQNGHKLTEQWLKQNKVPYDELITEKPGFDLLIDDRVESAFRGTWNADVAEVMVERINHMRRKKGYKAK